MKRLLLLFLVPLFGCVTTQPPDFSRDQPELVTMAPLPPFTSTIPLDGLRISVILHVMEDGSVGEARMIKSSGMSDWDTLALQSIKKWRFVAARKDGAPAATWLRQAIVVQVQEPIIQYLGELVVKRQMEADSLYALLTDGVKFETLATESHATSRDHCGYLGAVNIAIFPKHIRDVLKKLAIGDVTRPIRVGEEYVIYKRFKKDGPADVPLLDIPGQPPTLPQVDG
ncbi:MAG: TonB family protein [Bacteroidota bacterium]